MRVDRRSGVGSKFNSRSGWVSLLGEVLDLCKLGSTDAASEIFDFCDTLFWGVAAGLSLGSLLLCSLGGYNRLFQAPEKRILLFCCTGLCMRSTED